MDFAERGGEAYSWRGVWFCQTREALLRGARERAGQINSDALVALLRLPERIGGAPRDGSSDELDLRKLKTAMADAHPDRGGNGEDFIAARAAYEAARQELADARSAS